jgi:hypothetical protein
MKCPVCGCQEFFVKNPEDEFETRGFSVASGTVCFEAGEAEASVPGIQEATETYCNKCSWHGKLGELKRS